MDDFEAVAGAELLELGLGLVSGLFGQKDETGGVSARGGQVNSVIPGTKWITLSFRY